MSPEPVRITALTSTRGLLSGPSRGKRLGDPWVIDLLDCFLAQLGAIRFHVICSMGFGCAQCGLKNKSGPHGNDCIKGIPGGLLVIPQAVKKRGNLVHHVLSGQNRQNCEHLRECKVSYFQVVGDVRFYSGMFWQEHGTFVQTAQVQTDPTTSSPKQPSPEKETTLAEENPQESPLIITGLMVYPSP